MTIITKATSGYPDEYREALYGSDFDIRVTTTRDRDAYTTHAQGTISQTDRAFVFAALMEGLAEDEALDTLEIARNIVHGREWMRSEACNG